MGFFNDHMEMDTESSCEEWAREEFGHAQLSDKRRTERLVLMAARAATSPSGKLAAVFQDKAELQTGYDWIENKHIASAAVSQASHIATAKRCVGLPFVFIATDGSKLTITDRKKTKDTGPIGTRRSEARGDKVHSAMVISPEGTPIGLAGQKWWTRPDKRRTKHRDRCKVDEKEIRYRVEVREQARAVFTTNAPDVMLWFQHDREADAWPVVYDMVKQNQGHEYTTIRACWDRRLVAEGEAEEDAPTQYLRQTLAQTPICGHYLPEVLPGPHRIARQATMEVRACQVTLDLKDKATDRHYDAKVWVVCTQEVGTAPASEKPLKWLLLTTHPVTSFDDACLVVLGYSRRWRIEEFHRAWQSGCCNSQQMQSETAERRHKWATILASVAMRVIRLTYLSREAPEVPASQEFTSDEIEAMRDLVPKRPLPPTEELTLKEAVARIAMIGGYTGRSSGGPPGMITLARGLQRIDAHVGGLHNRLIRLAAELAGVSVAPARRMRC
jgi:hypothetical protein